MTRDDILSSLGTIARSGTAKFAQAMKVCSDSPVLPSLVHDLSPVSQTRLQFRDIYLAKFAQAMEVHSDAPIPCTQNRRQTLPASKLQSLDVILSKLAHAVEVCRMLTPFPGRSNAPYWLSMIQSIFDGRKDLHLENPILMRF